VDPRLEKEIVHYDLPHIASTPNLSQAQQQKLLMHLRCNHRNWQDINSWIRKGLLPVSLTVANCPDPVCGACQFGKAKRKPHAKATGGITKTATVPGAGVSADQLEVGCPGRIPTTKGLPTTKRYRYCNLWVDHYSRYVYPTFHETKHATELINSKKEFERFAGKFNVKIQRIRADNGVYSSTQFQLACEASQQELTFCAVGGHWQNGVAERYIGTITQTARTLLLHAITKLPKVLTEEFWPFAVRHACTFHKASINPATNLSPHECFTGEPPPWRISDFRVFGCPVFVLDKRLQDGDSLPKWRARCWSGVYVGHSMQHAGNVPLVYNPVTTHVSPQYHITFDDMFTTVAGTTATLSDAAFQALYDSEDWLFKHSFGTTADTHCFESYWSLPPSLPRKGPKSNTSWRHSTRLPRPSSPDSATHGAPDGHLARVPVANPPENLATTLASDHAEHPAGDHAIHLASDHAEHPAGDHAMHLASDHAEHPAGDHAMHLASDHAAHPAGDQAATLASEHSAHSAEAQSARFSSEHAVSLACDQVMHPTSNQDTRPATPQNACHTTHLPAPPTSASIPFSPALVPTDPSVKSGSAKLLSYVNLQPVACSAALKAYQAAHGININVYTTQSLGAPSRTSSPPRFLPLSQITSLLQCPVHPRWRQPIYLQQTVITNRTSSHKGKCSKPPIIRNSSNVRPLK
jgi:hypothetical protein